MYYFMCLDVLAECMSVYPMHTVSSETRRLVRSPGTGPTAVNHPVGPGNE